MKIFLFVLLSLGVFATEPEADNGNDWAFIDFVTRWTGTACIQAGRRLGDETPNPVPANVKDFTIHGSWPDRDDGTWPSFCNNSYPFNWNEISDMKSALDANWPSFTGPNPDFYAHEWNKHGTCALNVFRNAHDYFSRTLGFNSRWNLMGALKAGGFIPSATKDYPVSAMTTALSKAVGTQVAIQCQAVNKELHFLAVHICLNKSLQPINCPAFVVRDCQAGCYKPNIFMPPITSACIG